MENGPDKSNLYFLPKPEQKPKTELEKKEESRLTMENVDEVFYEAIGSVNSEDKPIWASNLISYQRFDENSLNKCKPRIARLLVQLQPRFFQSPGFDHTSAINNELQECWDTSKDRIHASRLLAVGKAAGLVNTATTRAEDTLSPGTPILVLGNRGACDKIIEDDKKKALDIQIK